MTVNGQSTYAAELARLARQLGEMQARINQLERGQNANTLANASIEGGSLTINDGTGSPAIVLGLQDDGTYAHAAVNASAPPQPSDPAVTPAILSAMVTWDGTMADGTAPLSDFAGIQVHCSAQAIFTPGPATLQSTFIAQGVRPVGGLLAGQTYYLCLVTVNQAGLTSLPSNVVSVVPSASIGVGQTIVQPVLVGSTTLGYASTTPRGPALYDFEFGLQGWTAIGGTLTQSGVWSATGQFSALLTADGVTQPRAVSPTGLAGIPVVAGDPVNLQFYFTASAALNNIYLGILWYDSAGNFISETDSADLIITGGTAQGWFADVTDFAPADGFVAFAFGDHNVDTAGTLIYFDTVQVSGNLAFSFSAVTGADPVGNTYDQGIQIRNLPGLQTALSVTNAFGDQAQATIDSAGNFTGATLSGNTDIILAGESLTDELYTELPQGVVAYSALTGNVPTPASAGAFVEELDVQLGNLRTYRITVAGLYASANTVGARGHATVYFTTDGSQPTTSSAILCHSYSYFPAAGDFPLPDMSRIYRASNVLLRMRLYISVSTGTIFLDSGQPNADAAAIVIEDIGPQIANTGIYQGGGSTGGGTQTYTKTYNIPHTYSYQGSDGGNPNLKIDTDGNCYQGGDSYDTYNGKAKTWLALPSAMGTDLSGATINWAKLYLNNNHTWYNAGMTLSLGNDTRTSFPGSAGDPSGASGYTHFAFSEGQAKWITLPSAHYSALTNPGGRSLVMWAGSNQLTYYGFFAGAGQGGRPQIQVNYTK